MTGEKLLRLLAWTSFIGHWSVYSSNRRRGYRKKGRKEKLIVNLDRCKGVVARNAFKLEFSELHIFFLFNGLNYIYRAYIWKNLNFLPCNTKSYMFDGILVTYAWNHFSKMHFMQLSYFYFLFYQTTMGSFTCQIKLFIIK